MNSSYELAPVALLLIGILTLEGCGTRTSKSSLDAKKPPPAAPAGPTASNAEAPSLTPPCPIRPNKEPPQPDKMALLFQSTKRYRLVIGAGHFRDPKDKKEERTYVEPTAKLVDTRLNELKYAPLPNLKTPLLTGKDATLQNIRNGLDTMRSVVGQNDMGVIYYVGHGIITDSHDDLSLAVYDRPVATGEGIRVSDILGILQDKTYHKAIPLIPHFLIILDTCYSGTAAKAQTVAIDESSGLQTIVYTQRKAVVPQIAILSATAPGSDNQAYNLHQTNFSAFGYFFARALDEDWECADVDSPDGIMTLNELKFYLKRKLQTARKLNAIDAAMEPTLLNGIEKSFIAYDSRYYSVPGARDEILDVAVSAPADTLTTILFPSGIKFECPDKQGCSFLLAKSNIGNLTVISQPKLDLGKGPTSATGSTLGSILGGLTRWPTSADVDKIGKEAHKDPAAVENIDLHGLRVDNVDVQTLILNKQIAAAGVTLKVKDREPQGAS